MEHRRILASMVLLSMIVSLFFPEMVMAEEIIPKAAYVAGKEITLVGKLSIIPKTKKKPETAILRLNEPVDFIGVVGADGTTMDYRNCKDIQVFLSKAKNNGKTVRIKGRLQGRKDGSNTFVRDYNLVNCKVTVIPDAEKVTLSKTKASVKVGGKLTLKAKVLPSAAFQTIKWNSSDKKVATVNANGKVTAHKKGVTTIKATTPNKKSVSCKVTVVVPVTGIKLSDETVRLSKGKTKTLKASVLPSNASEKGVTWSTSNKKIATVDKNGKVSGKSNGVATITATSKDGEKKAKCKVLVGKAPVKSITLSTNYIWLKPGETQKLTFKVKPENAKLTEINWSTMDPGIATIDRNGSIKGRRAGVGMVSVEVFDDRDGAAHTHAIYCVSNVPIGKAKMSAKDLSAYYEGKRIGMRMTFNEVLASFPGGVTTEYWDTEGFMYTYNNEELTVSFDEKGKMDYFSIESLENGKTARKSQIGDTLQDVMIEYGLPNDALNVTYSGVQHLFYRFTVGKTEYLAVFLFPYKTQRLSCMNVRVCD